MAASLCSDFNLPVADFGQSQSLALMQGTKRATTYGYSLHGFWLFGQPAT